MFDHTNLRLEDLFPLSHFIFPSEDDRKVKTAGQ